MPVPPFSDEPCVVDGNLITARFPYDLPRLVKAMVKQLVPAKALGPRHGDDHGLGLCFNRPEGTGGNRMELGARFQRYAQLGARGCKIQDRGGASIPM